MKTDNICDRCKKPMDTTIAEMNAIHYRQNFYACEHCGMLYSIYRPEFVIYKPLGYIEDKTEDDWGKKVISDKEYKNVVQANDINNEIIDKKLKISNGVLKRYTASKGKSLKWYEWIMNPNTRECERVLQYSEYTAVIDINQLDGEVMEIPYKEYKEWWDNNYHCLGSQDCK